MQLLTAGTRHVASLAFSPTCDALAAASQYTAPLLFALPATGDPIRLPTAYIHTVSFTFSADGNVVGWVSASKRNEYDRTAGTSRVVELVPTDERIQSQAVCGPDRRLVVRSVRIGQGGRFAAFAAFAVAVDGWSDLWSCAPSDGAFGEWMAGSPRSDRFFTYEITRGYGSGSRRLVARSALTGDEIAHTPIPLHYILGMAMHPEGEGVVVFKDSSLYHWAAGERVEKVRTGTLKHYNALAYHPDGRHLLAGNNDTTARLIDTQTWQVVRQYTWDIGRLTAVAVSADGALGAAGGEKGQIVVWDLDV